MEYRIFTARCPPKGVLRTVENKEYRMMKGGWRQKTPGRETEKPAPGVNSRTEGGRRMADKEGISTARCPVENNED